MLDTHTEVLERPDAQPLTPLARGIEFRDVSFAYDDGAGSAILRDVSFSVAAGQMVAIVGLSGAGKTTLVNLLPRFYDVTGGAILIDGVDIRDVTLELAPRIRSASSRRIPCCSTTRSPATSPTVRRGRRREAIEEAARAAHAHEFIQTLPDKYRHPDRRTRAAAVGRPAAAAGDRAGAVEELTDPDSGRSHLVT